MPGSFAQELDWPPLRAAGGESERAAAPLSLVATPPAGPPLRITHVVRQYAPGVGGLEGFVAALAAEQRAQGHHVAVVTLDRIFLGDGTRLPAAETMDGIAVRRVPFFGSPRYPIAPALPRQLGEADIVHVHGVDGLLDLLSVTRPIHRRRLVLSTHGGFFHTGFARRLKRVFFHTATRASLAGVAAVLASSEADAALFAQIAPGKTMLVENGVAIDRFRGLARPAARRIVYFGRLAPNKRLDRLIDWFAALHAHDPAWSLAIAGRPMGVAIAELREQAARRGVAHAVDFHDTPGDEELRRVIATSGVYASASDYEGFGLAAVEAVAAGLFPVLNDIPPFARTLARVGVGMLADFAAAPDPHAFLAAWARHAAAPPAAAALDARLAPFAWPGVAAAIADAYGRVLGTRTRRIGRVEVAVRDREEALAAIGAAVAARRRGVVTFCNAHTVNLAARDPGFARVLGTTLTLNDGVGVDLASRLLFGTRFPHNLNGTDFVPELLRRLPPGTRVFLLGSAPGVAAAAAARLAARAPGIVMAGTHHGFFGADEAADVTAAIAAARADLVLAGMGQPRQELWAAAAIDGVDCPIMCVGALLDFESGLIPRAPRAVQRAGLEWAFRLAMEPRRLASRYLVGNVSFLARIARQWLGGGRIAG